MCTFATTICAFIRSFIHTFTYIPFCVFFSSFLFCSFYYSSCSMSRTIPTFNNSLARSLSPSPLRMFRINSKYEFRWELSAYYILLWRTCRRDVNESKMRPGQSRQTVRHARRHQHIHIFVVECTNARDFYLWTHNDGNDNDDIAFAICRVCLRMPVPVSGYAKQWTILRWNPFRIRVLCAATRCITAQPRKLLNWQVAVLLLMLYPACMHISVWIFSITFSLTDNDNVDVDVSDDNDSEMTENILSTVYAQQNTMRLCRLWHNRNRLSPPPSDQRLIPPAPPPPSPCLSMMTRKLCTFVTEAKTLCANIHKFR